MVTLARGRGKMGLDEVDGGRGELENIYQSIVLMIDIILRGERGRADTIAAWTSAHQNCNGKEND